MPPVAVRLRHPGSRDPILLVVVALVAIAVAFFIAFGVSRGDVAALRFVREAPRATLATPRVGPALYSGTISGPDDRLDIGGNRAAARWWWVSERVSKNNFRTVCFEHQLDRMRFFDASGGSASLPMFDAAKDLSLLAAGRDDEWNEPLQIDLAEQEAYRPMPWPPEAHGCEGSGRTFVTQSIAAGARADVLACFAGGKLDACSSSPSAVIALGDIEGYVSRRAFHAAKPFLLAAGLAWIFLLALTFAAVRFRTRAIGAVFPEAPR